MLRRFSAKLWRCGDVMLERLECEGVLLGGGAESDAEFGDGAMLAGPDAPGSLPDRE